MNQQGILSPETFLSHWQGHRHLTRRVIEAFPEAQLFTFTAAPPMRTFGELAWECYGVAAYTLSGLVTDEWPAPDLNGPSPQDKRALLAAWDALTARLDAELLTVPPSRYDEMKVMFWGTMTAFTAAIYAVDNEIHHRAQGYVYLRALGIEPPPFYERGQVPVSA
ncbi:DinB family protein [Deinococcus maricopensis]|uniref:DinB family protein n=1 Tax=Deinococcus maricopensis (strain DSM 21211 / LMG 22137 / NRRL B-23946 / LB-34) TaxID=709986 RepID=E8UA40_DEIML|nr:DinB family protein [Deinococcus maricopensis]ADV67929.1 DinB family protein [Deinococcus maricopensis DSM 21211]